MSNPQTPPARPGMLSRRRLLQALGIGVAGGAALYGADSLSDTSAPRPDPPADALTRRTNPRNGDTISLLGFGAMRLPMRPEADSPNGPEVDEATTFAQVDYALAHGVNYFDTAWPYHRGQSEVVLGRALARHPRSSFFLADKMPTFLNPSLEQAKTIFAEQLKRCQVGYFDYYLLHGIQFVEIYQDIYEKNGVLDYLLEEKAKGRIRNLGWSFHGSKAMLEYLLARPVDWDFALVQLNYRDLLYRYEPNERQKKIFPKDPAPAQWMYDTLRATGLPLMVMEPLLGGRLARLNKKTMTVLRAERPEASAASWAFRFAGGLPNVLTVLSGMTSMEHLRDNVHTYAPLEPLSEQELAVLRKALELFITQENIRCTTCGYCTPCPYGVDIPAVFSHYNRCLDDEQIPKSTRDKNYEAARRAYLTGYERGIPELRQAARCTGCGECVKRCPQMIDIPMEMARLGKFVEQLRARV